MFNSVTALLQLAMSLLIAAQAPNVPQELRFQAINTANYAISYAQSQLHTQAVLTDNPEVVATPDIEEIPKSWADIKVDGKEGIVTLNPKNVCVLSANEPPVPCVNALLSWSSEGTIDPGCGITGGRTWAGNWGLNGSKSDTLLDGSVVKIECDTAEGKISDSVTIHFEK